MKYEKSNKIKKTFLVLVPLLTRLIAYCMMNNMLNLPAFVTYGSNIILSST